MNGHTTSTALRAFVHSLDRFDRLVLLMHFVDDLSLAEIAAVLDWPDHRVATAINRLHRDAKQIIDGLTNKAPTPAEQLRVSA
jgi:DNA-directed RNA polymerase specialized sigma24 family protein